MDVDVRMDLPKSAPSLSTSESPPGIRHPLPQEAHGNTATRTSDDPSISLEVDHMILDYLLHDTIQACHSDLSSLEQAVLRVDDFLALFNDRHPSYTPDPQLNFRQSLLQLLTLAVNRHRPTSATPPVESLLALRAENASRARSWITASSRPSEAYDLTILDATLPLAGEYLKARRGSILSSFTSPSTSDFDRSEQSISLLDLLPLFMHISALACTNLYASDINDRWMRLASEWMLQACSEQFLTYGASTSQCIDEAFAWGYQRNGEGIINDMFEDAEFRQEVAGWKEWKERRLGLLLMSKEVVRGGEDLVETLERIAEQHPREDFELSVIGFLEALGKCIPEPILVQLEKGKLEGMSRADTRDFLKTCGIEAEGGLAAASL